MSAAQHAPGPWKAVIYGGWDAPRVWSDSGSVALLQHHYSGPAVAEANARLIAAAPDLLNVVCEMEAFSEAALNDCIDANDEQGRIVWLARMEHCRAAIAKATGGST